MHYPRLAKKDLAGRVIDAHSHAGVALGMYGRAEYPYAQTIEGLYGQQRQGRVDIDVVFPFSADLYFDLRRLIGGRYVKARAPVSPVPYQAENTLLLREVFDYCPELSRRFLPFVSVDPARETRAQLRVVEQLLKRYPVYGIKINPAICQAPVIALLKEGRCFLSLAKEHNLPVLLHTSPAPADVCSYAGDAFKVIEEHPGIRFCLAHCILFSKPFLDRALAAPNAWVDTAAFKIQVDVCRDVAGRMIKRSDLIDADFTDYDDVFAAICDRYGERIVWGTDSPAYAYICRRKLNAARWQRFDYKGTYDDEVRLLRNRPPGSRRMIANRNTIRFLMGP